jgi:hypothetical protein
MLLGPKMPTYPFPYELNKIMNEQHQAALLLEQQRLAEIATRQWTATIMLIVIGLLFTIGVTALMIDIYREYHEEKF